jgi:hypothetical protein
MAANLLHVFNCTIAEAGTSGGAGQPVGPAEWNAAHQLYLDADPRTTVTEAILAASDGALVTFSNASAVAASIGVAVSGAAPIGSSLAFYKGWFCFLLNIGAGAVTLTPATSTINGAATLVLTQNQGALVISDGANYRALTFRNDLPSLATALATASTLASRDANGNSAINNLLEGYATTATAAGTTTLTVGSAWQQYFTGTTTQIVALPVVSTLILGQSWLIQNNSTGIVTVNSSGGNLVAALPPGAMIVATCILTSSTSAASWAVAYPGYLGVPQNSQSAAYTTVMADAGRHILHPSADTTARTWTIDSNTNVPYPIGSAITFVNQNAGGVITVAITTDTMRLAGAGTTGSRTLAANGIATALKVAATEWIISGTGLT